MRQHFLSVISAACTILALGSALTGRLAVISRWTGPCSWARTTCFLALVCVSWIVFSANTAHAQIRFDLTGKIGEGYITLVVSGSSTPTRSLRTARLCWNTATSDGSLGPCGQDVGDFLSIKVPGPDLYMNYNGGFYNNRNAELPHAVQSQLADPGGCSNSTGFAGVAVRRGAAAGNDLSAGTSLDPDVSSLDDFNFGLSIPMDFVAGDPVSCSGVMIFDIDASEISAPTGSVFNWQNDLGMEFQLVIGQIEESAPGFTKEFAETELEVGETTTMTFTIDNSSHRVTIQNVAFVDNFPAGMVIADVPNVTISNETVNKDYGNTPKCTGTINAVAGASTFELSGGTIAYGEVCTITVDIMATKSGPLTNVTEELTSCISTHVGATASVTIEGGEEEIARTSRIISNFMARRAAQIVGNEPDLTKRLADGGMSSRSGPVSGPVNVSGNGTANNYNLAFSTSLRQVVGSSSPAKRKRVMDSGSRMTLGAAGAAGGTSGRKGSQQAGASSSSKDEPTAPDQEFANRPLTGFGFWTEGTLSKVDAGTTKSDFDMVYVGADYRFRPGLVVGLLAQFDHTEEEDGTNGFAVKGTGWLAGPYVVARLGSNLILDARAAWGRSDNEVSPYNTYADEFKGRRKLLRGRLTGDFQFGRLHVAPHVGMVYYEEEQKAYTDSLGNTISSQKVELGRFTFGPKLSMTFTRPDGATVTPHVAVHGIWDFKRTDIVNIDTGLALTGTDDFRARTQAGITARRADGMAITAEGFYDGIGADGFYSYGGTLRFDVPF